MPYDKQQKGCPPGRPFCYGKPSVYADDRTVPFRYTVNWGNHGHRIREHKKELITMADKADKPEKIEKTKPKRLSKSERTHRRRLKQAAKKPAAAGS